MALIRRLALGLATALALLACSAGIASAAGNHRSGGEHRALGAAQGIYWGAWIGPQLTGEQPPWDMSAATRFGRLLGKRPSLLEFSQPFANCGESCESMPFPTAEMTAIRKFGSIPLLSWGSQANGAPLVQPEYTMAGIAAGSQDAYVRSFAEAAKAWGHPFFLRFNWEMNGNWFPWGARTNGNTPATIVAAWRHVHDIFTQVGATNATWVWCPYADSTGRFGNLSRFYPGNRYVDWTCLDGYNWGTNAVNPAPWRSFDQIFGASYAQLTKKIAPGKPVMLGEVASNGSARIKSRWIRQMFKAIAQRYQQVRALAWFDQSDRDLNWSLETSPQVLKAFSRGIHSRSFQAARFGALNGSPIPPPR
ncbi:MAG: hypothetical protein JST31_00945 [Actinobacteria bacterium]|nr:hypothetical protein [Actinomycetota bacterium]